MVSGHWQPPLSRSSAKCCPVVAGSNPGGQDGVCHGRSLNLRSDSIRGWDVCRFSGDRRSRLTLWVGWIANRHSRRLLLIAAAVLMAATGACFAVITDFWPLLVIAFVGTMNPTSGDASIFVPLEQTVLTQTIAARSRTALFARYSVIGSCATALGVLAAALPDFITAWTGCTRAAATQLMFGLYGVLGLLALLLYRPLSSAVEMAEEAPKAPLQESKRLVYGMAALFGMDSLGTGFLVQSLLALWLYQAFAVSVTTTAAILFWSSLCSAVSDLLAVPIAARIGLYRRWTCRPGARMWWQW
jgi:MFS family permease